MRKFQAVNTAGMEGEVSTPPKDRILAGDPQFTTWNVAQTHGELYAGVWEATPGKWRVTYEEWEFCHILSGISIITEDGGEARRVEAGSSFVLWPGFFGTWEVVETTRKEYVIQMP